MPPTIAALLHAIPTAPATVAAVTTVAVLLVALLGPFAYAAVAARNTRRINAEIDRMRSEVAYLTEKCQEDAKVRSSLERTHGVIVRKLNEINDRLRDEHGDTPTDAADLLGLVRDAESAAS